MILVTGGAGSIGSEVVRRLVADGESVRVMDINEEALWSLKCELPDIEVVLGDVCNPSDNYDRFDGVGGLIHCAAMKHVDLCERNPRMAFRVNEKGTQKMLEALRYRKYSYDNPFVMVSTDKALFPESVMGQSKHGGEVFTLSHGGNVVRFGNVIGTRGSLVPMVQRCAALGRDIPLTDPAMTRWMMPVDEAVFLIMEALESKERGKVFGPINPGAVNIGRFVELCRDELAPDCKIVRTGMRPGERLHEPMELRDGRIVWSNEVPLMSDQEMLALIEQAVAA